MLNSEYNVTVLDILFFLLAFLNLLVLAVASLAFETVQLLDFSFIIHAGRGSPLGRRGPGW